MPDNRCKLHLTKLDAFAEFMAESGWRREPTKGFYEVLRLVKEGDTPMIFYARGTAREHATVQYGAQASAVRRFLRAVREARER